MHKYKKKKKKLMGKRRAGVWKIVCGGIHFLSKEVVFSFRSDPKDILQKASLSFLPAS